MLVLKIRLQYILLVKMQKIIHLLDLYAKREASKGFAFKPDTEEQIMFDEDYLDSKDYDDSNLLPFVCFVGALTCFILPILLR